MRCRVFRMSTWRLLMIGSFLYSALALALVFFGRLDSGVDPQHLGIRKDGKYNLETIELKPRPKPPTVNKTEQGQGDRSGADDRDMREDGIQDGDKNDDQEGRISLHVEGVRKYHGKSKVDPDTPGEMGKPVVIDKKTLSSKEREKYDRGWHDNSFNAYVSDMISLHRTLPDVRDQGCKTLKYKEKLPGACVIVIFHNEALSVLLRTVHSVLDRSMPELLQEVILVDDFSNFEHLKQPLDDFVAKQPKVSLIRASKRSGLIRARLMGFEKCTAEVAIFLDSHCEAFIGWLEPLLDPIARDPTTVAIPTIDTISDNTFAIFHQEAMATQTGGFHWGLIFTWHSVADEENRRRNYSYHLPFRTATMAGGLFAINSQFFRKLGTYDPGMDIWGGENLELSFKTWMCGGTMITVPCSHVGHVFRRRIPYTWGPKANVIKLNLVRLAEVWMDEFKIYYYDRINYQLGNYGDVSERKALRERLQCNSFKWYINNVYPELVIPAETLAHGEIRSAETSMCADASAESHFFNQPVIGYPCHNEGGNQYWLLTKDDQIYRDEACWDYSGGDEIKMMACPGYRPNQLFQYRKDGTIYSPTYKKCATLSLDGRKITMQGCSGNKRQQWVWSRSPLKGPTRD